MLIVVLIIVAVCSVIVGGIGGWVIRDREAVNSEMELREQLFWAVEREQQLQDQMPYATTHVKEHCVGS